MAIYGEYVPRLKMLLKIFEWSSEYTPGQIKLQMNLRHFKSKTIALKLKGIFSGLLSVLFALSVFIIL